VAERCLDKGKVAVRFVVLDFRHVFGMDSSSAMSFVRMKQFASKRGIKLVMASLPDKLDKVLEREEEGIAGEPWLFFPDLDHAMEWCEDRILDSLPPEEGTATPIEEIVLTPAQLRYFTRVEVPPGTELLKQGSPSEELYFIERGTVSILLADDAGRSIRIRTMRSGNVVGEVGMYLDEDRSASVTAVGACTVLRLDRGSLLRMEREAPDAAAAFHRLIAMRLAGSLRNTDATLKALLD
jgi:SulP family sulfate permease